jgi:hypothetical protein
MKRIITFASIAFYLQPIFSFPLSEEMIGVSIDLEENSNLIPTEELTIELSEPVIINLQEDTLFKLQPQKNKGIISTFVQNMVQYYKQLSLPQPIPFLAAAIGGMALLGLIITTHNLA